MPQSQPPLVSVVTPVKNRARTIRGCLASVASQLYPAVEHIVVDGASTDGTLEVIKEAAVDHPIRWISEADSGMYEAINKGLSMARGEILCYLNSDDLYLPWSVHVAVETLRRGVDLVYGDLGVLKLSADDPSTFYVQFYRDFDLVYFTHTATIGQPTVFWKRSLTERIGPLSLRYRLIADCEYWLRAATNGARIQHVNEVLAVQMEHATTLRALHRDRLREEFQDLRAEYGTRVQAPRWPAYQRVRRGLAYRRSRLAFWVAARRPGTQKWKHFLEFLRRREIPIDQSAMLMSLLPERVRPAGRAWGDPREVERQIMAEIGVERAS